MAELELVRLPDLDAVAVYTEDRIAKLASEAVAARGSFAWCVDGGRPTQKLLAKLAQQVAGNTPAAHEVTEGEGRPDEADRSRKDYFRQPSEGSRELPWERTTVFLGDERRVPKTDPRSNRGMVDRLLLSKLAHAPAFFGPDGDAADGDAAARAYEELLVAKKLDAPDLLLLGMGPDGHTASIFPGSPALGETDRLVVHVPAPTTVEPHVDRLTLTPKAILAAKALLLFAVGVEKKSALARLLSADGSEADTPSRLIRRFARTATVIADQAALGG